MKPSLNEIFGAKKPSLNDIFGSKPVEKENYFQRVVNSYKEGGDKVISAIKSGAQDIATGTEISSVPGYEIKGAGKVLKGMAESGLNTVGAIAGAAFTPITAALEPAIKPVVEKLMTIPGVQNNVAKVSEWAKNNPQAAKDLQSVFDIATLGVGGATEKVAKDGISAGAKVVSNATDSAISTTKNLVGTGLEKTGQKIQNTVIKPSIRDVEDGFKIENVSKYDVGGSLPETIAKTHTKMNELTSNLNQILSSSDAKVNLDKVYKETLDSLTSGNARSFGDNKAIQNVIKNLKSEISQVSKNGEADLVNATNIKRGAGAKGAWSYNRPEPDASAIEKVYTTFYNKLKTEIENVSPDGVKDINKQISDLIPINNAALRRMTVEERNNALSLMDNIGLVSSVFDPKALLLFGANRALRSGRVGSALIKAGQNLKGISPTK